MDGSSWQSEQLYFSGDDYFAAIEKEIELAQKSIDVESYIFEYDRLGQRIVAALEEAAKRGLRIRVLVDGVGTAIPAPTLENKFAEAGIEFKVHHRIFRSFRNINRRNHRKVWIFDNRVLFVGSFNVSEVHTSLVTETWRDNGMRVEGEDVNLVIEAFEKTWTQKKIWRRNPFKKESLPVKSLVRLNQSRAQRRAIYQVLLLNLRQAQKAIYFGNAYFSPHFRLVMELCFCARRGVQVHLIVPRKSDVFFMPWVASTYYYVLLRSGVKIYEYLPRIFHAKNYIIDDWMFMGSSNLNRRSLFHDLEIDLIITHPDNKQRLFEEMQKDLKQSEPVTFKFFGEQPWIRQKLTKVILMFKNWM